MDMVDWNQSLIPNSGNFFVTFGSFILLSISESFLSISHQPYLSVINAFEEILMWCDCNASAIDIYGIGGWQNY